MKFFMSIRTRLTIWYLVVMIVLLLLFSTLAYFMPARRLYQNLDNSLQARAFQLKATAVLAGQPNELLLSFDSNGNLIQEFGPAIDVAGIAPLVKQAQSGDDVFLTTVTSDKQGVRLYATSFRVPFNDQIVIVVGQ